MSSKKGKAQKSSLKKKNYTSPNQIYIDYDYVDDLSDEEKEWLGRFTREYYGGSFEFSDEYNNMKGDKRTFQHSVPPEKKYSDKCLHKTLKEKRECYNRNDANKRDVYTLSKISFRLGNNIDDYYEKKYIDYEDEIIEILDRNDIILKKKPNKSKKRSDSNAGDPEGSFDE
jgi:hypothetical protein